MAEKPFKNGDRDLLIKLNTQVERLISDVSDLGNKYSERINNLEENKTDKIYMDKVTVDFEARHRVVEKFMENFLGRLTVLAGVVSLVVTCVMTFLTAWIKSKI